MDQELKEFLQSSLRTLKSELTERIDAGESRLEATISERVEAGDAQTRRYMEVLYERLDAKIALVAEGQQMLQEQMNRRFDELERIVGGHTTRLDDHEVRLTAFEKNSTIGGA